MQQTQEQGFDTESHKGSEGSWTPVCCLGVAFFPTLQGQPCRQSGRQFAYPMRMGDLTTPQPSLCAIKMLQPSHQRRRTADRGRLALRASSSTSSKRRSANSEFKSTSASSASSPASSPTCSKWQGSVFKGAQADVGLPLVRLPLALSTHCYAMQHSLLQANELSAISLLAGAYNRCARAAQL